MLDLVKLATLCAVARHGSFSAAAQALRLTQPAVSRQISLLERQAGIQLVTRGRHGIRLTEAGRVLAGHAEGILGRVARAEAEVAELAGLRRGHVRLGSFFTALARLSPEVSILLEARHPDLFAHQPDVIRDELVDRRTAFAHLVAGDLDVAIVFESELEPHPPPDDIEIIPMFTDPPRALLPAGHPLAAAPTVSVADLAHDTWIKAHRGSAARLVDHVLHTAGLRPTVIMAGHGDEPVETQAFVAAGHGVTLAHELNVLIDPARITVAALTGDVPARRVQAAIMRDQHSPAARAVLAVLREIGRRHETG